MADWLSELVESVCRELLASEDVRNKLALADPDRVTAQSITEQIAGQESGIGPLRHLLDGPVGSIEELDLRRELRLQELLPREGKAVLEALRHLDFVVRGQQTQRMLAAENLNRASPGIPATLSGGSTHSSLLARVRATFDDALRRLPPKRSVPVQDPAAAAAFAELALRQARQDLHGAAEHVRPDQELEKIRDERAGAVSALREQLAEVLARQINLIIDGALAASHEPEFSYSGSAWLVDQPTTAAEALGTEVNGEAVSAIQNMIGSGLTGAVGVAGPRGIGKTTLLTRFARSAPGQWPAPPWAVSRTMPSGGPDEGAVRQWGVCVAAPAQYDARDFLLHLFGQLCTAVLGEAAVRVLEGEMTGASRGPGRFAQRIVLPVWYLAVTALLCGALVLGLETSRPVGPAHSMTDLLIAGCGAVVAIMTALMPSGLLMSLTWQVAGSTWRQRCRKLCWRASPKPANGPRWNVCAI